MKSAQEVDSAACSIRLVFVTLSHFVRTFKCGRFICTIAETEVRQVAIYLVGSVR